MAHQRTAMGDSRGMQPQDTRKLPEEYHTGHHGSWRSGIETLLPSSQHGDWAQYQGSHPDKVYAATTGERQAWQQAEMAGSKKLGDIVTEADDPTKFVDQLVDDPVNTPVRPTVYETRLRGEVTADPEYDKGSGNPGAARGDYGEVQREIPMPMGAQGTLLPDFYGRRSSFDTGFRGMLVDEEVGALTGQRYVRGEDLERQDRDAAREEYMAGPQDISLDTLNRMPGEQMTRNYRDRGVAAILRNPSFMADASAEVKDTVRAEQRSPRLFGLDEVTSYGQGNFPYGKPAGWDDRREAFGWGSSTK
jgi:hypothetical protein